MRRLIFAALLGVFPGALFAAPIDDACRARGEEIRTTALSRLYRAEEDFREASWRYRKAQIIIYGPLWQALQLRRDRYAGFSKNSEGDIRYKRYRLEADQEIALAEEKMTAALSEIRFIRKQSMNDELCGRKVDSNNPGDTISLFGNCMEIWKKETDDLLLLMSGVLKKYRKKEHGFTQKMEASLDDSQSDHDAFKDRFRDDFVSVELDSKFEYMNLAEKIREKYESRWCADQCCAQCSAEKRAERDPVLSQVKLDPQGDRGAAGRVVNTARLLPAFERLNEAEKNAAEPQNDSKS